METLVQADIFFFISSVALVLLTVGLLIVIFFSVKILRNIAEISEKLRDEGSKIIEDVSEARRSVREEGVRLKHALELILRTFAPRPKKSRHAGKHKPEEPDVTS